MKALPSTILVLAIAAPVLLYRLGSREVNGVVEARVAITAREMWRSGEWILPTMHGRPRLEKPPLAYWLPEAAALLRGTFDELTLRAPFALLALGAVLLTLGLGRELLGPEAGLLAAVALVSSAFFVKECRAASADVALFSSVAGAFLFCARSRRHIALGSGDGLDRMGVHFFLGVGALSKGPVILALVLLPAVVEAALRRSWQPLRPFWSPPGIVLFLLLGLAWPVLAAVRAGDGAVARWLHESFGKVLPAEDAEEGAAYQHHPGPWYFYIPRLASCFGLWAPALPFALFRATRRCYRVDSSRGSKELCWLEALPLLWFVVTIAFFSVMTEKKPQYLLPVLVPGALLVAAELAAWGEKPRIWLRRIASWFLWPAAAAALAAVVLALAPGAATAFRRIAGDGVAGADAARLTEEVFTRCGGSVTIASAILVVGAWFFRRALATASSSRPFIVLGATVALAVLPYEDFRIAMEPEGERMKEQAAAASRLLKPGEPLRAIAGIPEDFLYYLDARLELAGSVEEARAKVLHSGAQLLVPHVLLEPFTGDAGSPLGAQFDGFRVVRILNPGAARSRDRCVLLEKI